MKTCRSTTVFVVVGLVISCFQLGTLAEGYAAEWIEFPQREDTDGEENQLRVVESTPEALILEASLPGMYLAFGQMADGRDYTIVTAAGAAMREVGHPAVPVLAEWILIPNGTEVEIDVDPGEPVVFDHFVLPPVPAPMTDDDEALLPIFERNEEIYGQDADSPGVFARLEPIGVIRGKECTIIRVFPYQFNPVRETLTVYPDLSVTLRFMGDPLPFPPELKSHDFDRMMRRMAINADAILTAEAEAARQFERISDDPPSYEPYAQYGWDYLIITVSKFSNPANTFAAWKKKCGFKPLVSIMPSTYTAADIRASITNAYHSWDIPPKYILILGDAEYIPCHYKTWHPDNTDSQNMKQGYTGTDLYYACMTDSDYWPDLAIGRLSVDTEVQANARIQAIISYESDPPLAQAYYDNVTLCSQFQDGFQAKTPDGTKITIKPDGIADRRFVQSCEDMAIFLSDPKHKKGKTIKRVYYTDPQVTPAKWNDNSQNMSRPNFGGYAGKPGDPIPSYLLRKNGFNWNGNFKDIQASLKAGTFLLVHRGHGGRQNWKHPFFFPGYYACSYFNGFLPVVWSMNCQTGWFDNETDFQGKAPSGIPLKDETASSSECHAEWWLRPTPPPGYKPEEAGAVGIIAATRVSYSIYNDHLSQGWMAAIWEDFSQNYKPGKGMIATTTYRMGETLNQGKFYMATKVPDDTTRKTEFEIFHWFGDPAMAIWTNKPNYVVADFPRIWEWALTPNDFVIRNLRWAGGEKTGLAIEGATITITKDDSEVDFFVGKTDEEGQLVLPGLVAYSLGTYNVTITAPGAIPYQTTFESLPGPAMGEVISDR